MKDKIQIYTDGASRGNPGPGGYAAILISKDKQKEIAQGFRKTTNNRMELLAVIAALETLQKACDCIIYSDSKYVINAITKGWLESWIQINFKNKKNKDLWLKFYDLYKKHDITFHWVRGHDGNFFNEKCDELAVKASKKQGLKIDAIYELNIQG